ncbi:Ca-activated chloride channel family protein [Pontibacter ummariensis]|uniref:Ca-activated chloride channel family protein n=1 Tax=Pontibacter ummariensis TaxID=1610492 RepID=A0A239C526_9BACT|nr:VWA domain-containing protein [Pontibacter ummariensis]PRY15452.1 Ca-activated chloride channel family protein [Pontibacter ummariensis]SNS15019.1 Ca-activated chloride channel family protein [Pontibacter ummariensis]
MLRTGNDFWDWLSLEWFSFSTLGSFDWVYPLVLYGLPAVPLLFLLKWLFTLNSRNKLDMAMFEGKVRWQWSSVLRHLPNLVFMLFMMLVVVALARPQRVNEQVELNAEGIDIVLALDVSGSMELEDIQPNRLTAAKEVALNFIEGRVQDRIGMVVFAGDAYSLAPLTTDYQLLRDNINSIGFQMIPNDGTAIGSALAVAINRMRDSEAKSKVVILISDGENTAGSLNPELAAQLAYAYGIKLYTIGIGKDGQVAYEVDETGKTLYVETQMDESTLRQIATIGAGQFFRADSKSALQEIFNKINKLEKTEVTEKRFRDTKDYYQVYLKWALLLLLIWMLLKNTFITNVLED